MNASGSLQFRIAYDAYGESRHSWAKDIDSDGDVDATDESLATAASGNRIHQAGYNADADWNRDGRVNSTDLAGFGSSYYESALAGGLLASPTSDFNIGFCGYRFNAELGAYTVRFRHYDPTPGVARWLERDPAGYVDGPSLHGYLGRSPVDGFDPSGLARDYFDDAIRGYQNHARQSAHWAGSMFTDLEVLGLDIAEIIVEEYAYGLAFGLAAKLAAKGISLVFRDGWMVATQGFSNGLGAMAGKRMPKVAKTGVVIGEKMKRVKKYASEHGLETIDDWMERNGVEVWTRDVNDRWVKEMMEEGRTFHDIGPWWERRLDAEKIDKVRHGPKWREGTENYTRERWHLRDYKNRIRTDEYKVNPRRRGPSCRRRDYETITKQRDHLAEARSDRPTISHLCVAA